MSDLKRGDFEPRPLGDLTVTACLLHLGYLGTSGGYIGFGVWHVVRPPQLGWS